MAKEGSTQMTEQEKQQHMQRIDEIRTVVREFVRERSGFNMAARTQEEFAANLALAEPWVLATIDAMALELGEALCILWTRRMGPEKPEVRP